MWTSKTAFLLITLLCINLCARASKQHEPDHQGSTDPSQEESKGDGRKETETKIKTYKKEWKYQSGKIFKYATPIANFDNSFLFAICSQEDMPTRTHCEVRLEAPVELWNSTRLRKISCKLDLSADEGHEITGIVSVERFSSARAIVVWWQRRKDSQYQVHKIGVSIVPFSTCTAHHLLFPVDVDKRVLLSNVVTYPDAFDVIVTNGEICGLATTCRISHNASGQRIGKPAPFVTNFDAVRTLPVDPDSAEDGFYVYGTDVVSWKFRSMHVSSDGKVRHLMSASGVSDPRQLLQATSNSHKLYGICVIGNRKFHCAQFDAEANVVINAAVSVSRVQWVAFYNLLEGEALQVTGNCHNHKCRSFKVVRIKEGGKRLQTIDVPNLNMKCYDVPNKFSVDVADNHDHVCFAFACHHDQEVEGKAKSSVKFINKCILKEDLFANNILY